MIWRTPTRHPELEPDRVHAWRLDQPSLWPGVPFYKHVLSASEKSRADRFVFEPDRRNFVTARWALRVLLGRYLGQEPENVLIEETAFGKPYTSKLLNNKPLKFNLSHSHGLCVAVFALSKETGVDVEHIRPDVAFDDLAERYFAGAEKEALQLLDPNLRKLGFWAIWTRKEAYVKARGAGLQIPLDSFSVSVDPAQEVPSLVSHDQDRWAVRSFQPQDNFIGACVIENPLWSVDFWDFQAEP